MCKHRCDRRPKVGKLPTPSSHRCPTLTPTVRGSRLTLAAASRCSKICPIDRPRQHACKHRCDRVPNVRQAAHAGPSRSTGVRRSRSPHLGLTPPPRVGRPCTCAMPQKAFEKPKPRSENCLRPRAIALPHSRRLCAAAGLLPPPFLDGRKSIPSTTCATFARHNQLRARIRIGNPLFSGCASLSTPATGAFTDAGRDALAPEHAPP